MLNSLAKELMILRAFCVLIALSMGMVSPVLANAGQANSELTASAFALPDGTLQVICFGNGGRETENAVHCDDCLLSGKPLAKPSINDGVPLAVIVKTGNVWMAIQSNNLHDFLKRQQSRAPPVI